MTPEKNGCNVWLEEYGCWVHGDSYHLDGILMIRTCPDKLYGKQLKQTGVLREHYRVPVITHWFDEHERYGLLICKSGWDYYGYEGRDISHLESLT